MTYGGLIYFPYGVEAGAPPFPEDVVRNSKYRRFDWTGSLLLYLHVHILHVHILRYVQIHMQVRADRLSPPACVYMYVYTYPTTTNS